MLKLCGFAVSNYYNKVKLSLLEKGIPFEEELVYPSQKEEFRKDSPMGKVPFLRTEHGVLTESQVLTEYIEDLYPEPALYPKDAFERARIRELIEHIELHLELPADISAKVKHGKRLHKDDFVRWQQVLHRKGWGATMWPMP